MEQVDLKKIKNLRKKKGFTQKYMAQKLGYRSDIGYHYLESGRCQIKANQLKTIAYELEVDIDSLYENTKAIAR